MYKQTEIHTYNGILFSNTDKIICLSLKYFMVTKDATGWMIPFIAHAGKGRISKMENDR